MSNEVESKKRETARLDTHFLDSGPEAGKPVVFIHGNVSSSVFFADTMAAMPERYRSLAVDLRGFGGSQAAPVDATRGLADFADDVRALVEELELGSIHLVGWSLGGGVALQYATDHSGEVASLTLVAPMSPFGFGGTKDIAGTPCWPDFAGSGGGTANPEFVQRLRDGERSAGDPNSPRSVMNALYFKPPFRAEEREEEFVDSLLSTATGDDNYPGDGEISQNWPTVAPGDRGVNNALSPKYCDLGGFSELGDGPPVLWVRGAEDRIVSDTSFLDFGFLGQQEFVPGWPGEEVYPPQPMVSQTRAVLENYGESGGHYTEAVLQDCGHSPHIEQPEEFRRLFFGFLQDTGR